MWTSQVQENGTRPVQLADQPHHKKYFKIFWFNWSLQSLLISFHTDSNTGMKSLVQRSLDYLLRCLSSNWTIIHSIDNAMERLDHACPVPKSTCSHWLPRTLGWMHDQMMKGASQATLNRWTSTLAVHLKLLPIWYRTSSKMHWDGQLPTDCVYPRLSASSGHVAAGSKALDLWTIISKVPLVARGQKALRSRLNKQVYYFKNETRSACCSTLLHLTNRQPSAAFP